MSPKTPFSHCYRCRVQLDLCICENFKSVATQTRILVLMHWGELSCISNTGRLIPKLLSNSEIRYRGNPDRSPVQLEDMLNVPNTFVLYPAHTAKVLDDNFKKQLSTPANLIVIDGNWGQASQMMRKETILQKLPKVILPKGLTSNYHLRRNQIPGNVCTFEAVAKAIGILESKTIQENLEKVFDQFISRSLYMRGKIRKVAII